MGSPFGELQGGDIRNAAGYFLTLFSRTLDLFFLLFLLLGDGLSKRQTVFSSEAGGGVVRNYRVFSRLTFWGHDSGGSRGSSR